MGGCLQNSLAAVVALMLSEVASDLMCMARLSTDAVFGGSASGKVVLLNQRILPSSVTRSYRYLAQIAGTGRKSTR